MDELERTSRKYFSQDRFAIALLGIEILEFGQGFAKCRMSIREDHLNGLGTVQGGAIFTLADLTFAVASNASGTVAVAINANIAFTKAVSSGVLYAEAKECTLSNRLGNYAVTVTDESGDTVALFQGTAYRKKETTAQHIRTA